MSLHTDIPTRAQIDRLFTSRNAASVSAYVPTDPASAGQAERIELKNLATEAERQLTAQGATRSDLAARPLRAPVRRGARVTRHRRGGALRHLRRGGHGVHRHRRGGPRLDR